MGESVIEKGKRNTVSIFRKQHLMSGKKRCPKTGFKNGGNWDARGGGNISKLLGKMREKDREGQERRGCKEQPSPRFL